MALTISLQLGSAPYANCDARFERTDEQALVASLLIEKLLGYVDSKAMTTLWNDKKLQEQGSLIYPIIIIISYFPVGTEELSCEPLEIESTHNLV